MTSSGVIEYNVSYEDFMEDPWSYYNEDCDPGFQGRVIIDDDYMEALEYLYYCCSSIFD